jgi:ABC-type Zn uptake system ZnuABC Zn-binding protein ZnuA
VLVAFLLSFGILCAAIRMKIDTRCKKKNRVLVSNEMISNFVEAITGDSEEIISILYWL